MLRNWKNWVLIGCLSLASVPAHAAMHFRTGVFVGPVYPAWGMGPYWGYRWPYMGRAYILPSHPHSGQLKVDTKDKSAQVYLDGAYAGTVKEVNSAWLPEGNHQIEVRQSNGQVFDQQIHVLAGRTLHVRPNFAEGSPLNS